MIVLPLSLTIMPTPWKNPRNLGLADLWSLINLTLMVSIGVTAKIASQTPALKPANRRRWAFSLPSSSTRWFFTLSNAPNLTADFGIEPYISTDRPRYKPNTPWLFTVFVTQSIIPVYCRPAPAFPSNCSWVFTYSVGYVMHISIPPVIPPGLYNRQEKH